MGNEVKEEATRCHEELGWHPGRARVRYVAIEKKREEEETRCHEELGWHPGRAHVK